MYVLMETYSLVNILYTKIVAPKGKKFSNQLIDDTMKG